MNKFQEYKKLKNLTGIIESLNNAIYEFLYNARTDDSELLEMKSQLQEQRSILESKYQKLKKDLDIIDYELGKQ